MAMARNQADASTEVAGYVTRVASLAGTTGNPGHEIAMSLRGAYLAMHRQSDANFAAYGITADQFIILASLNDGSVLTQSEMCRRTYTDPNTMGSMLALLQSRGLVRRMKHPKDGRVRTVALTPKGKRICTKAFAGVEAFRARLAGLFTEEELEAFLRHLKSVIQELSPPPRSRKKRKNKTLTVAKDT
jgi:DNA-binding MarR family transcriptional regulator